VLGGEGAKSLNQVGRGGLALGFVLAAKRPPNAS